MRHTQKLPLKLVLSERTVMWHKLATGTVKMSASPAIWKVAQIASSTVMKASRKKKSAAR